MAAGRSGVSREVGARDVASPRAKHLFLFRLSTHERTPAGSFDGTRSGSCRSSFGPTSPHVFPGYPGDNLGNTQPAGSPPSGRERRVVNGSGRASCPRLHCRPWPWQVRPRNRLRPGLAQRGYPSGHLPGNHCHGLSPSRETCFSRPARGTARSRPFEVQPLTNAAGRPAPLHRPAAPRSPWLAASKVRSPRQLGELPAPSPLERLRAPPCRYEWWSRECGDLDVAMGRGCSSVWPPRAVAVAVSSRASALCSFQTGGADVIIPAAAAKHRP